MSLLTSLIEIHIKFLAVVVLMLLVNTANILYKLFPIFPPEFSWFKSNNLVWLLYKFLILNLILKLLAVIYINTFGSSTPLNKDSVSQEDVSFPINNTPAYSELILLWFVKLLFGPIYNSLIYDKPCSSIAHKGSSSSLQLSNDE